MGYKGATPTIPPPHTHTPNTVANYNIPHTNIFDPTLEISFPILKPKSELNPTDKYKLKLKKLQDNIELWNTLHCNEASSTTQSTTRTRCYACNVTCT